jgi:hypothetical protein
MKFHLDEHDPASWLGFAGVFIQEERVGRSFLSSIAWLLLLSSTDGDV